MGIIKVSTAIFMFCIFTVALITFALNFAIDNDATVTLGSDFTNESLGMDGEVSALYIGADIAFNAFQEGTISSQTESSEGGTQFKTTPTGTLSQARRGLTIGWKSIFGTDAAIGKIMTGIIAILILIVGFYAWAAWKGNVN